jgi:hypothetical protein
MKQSRGGARPNAGRKPDTAEVTASILLRLTPEMRDWVNARGGAVWIRSLIEREQQTP